ncbi:MAG: cytochrome c family protein [Caulobacter sp.]|nr:cytochrome c family protein [Caulobacter sp.]
MRLIVLAAAAALLAGPALAADGAAIYNSQCKACHGAAGAGGPAGPALKGVARRKVASAPGFAYSAGLKAKGGAWTDPNLDAFLTNPGGFAPGSKMFARAAQPGDRAAVIAYLKTLK